MARFLPFLADALGSNGWLSSDQAILEAESIQVFHGLMRPPKGFFLGLLEKRGPLLVQFFDPLDRCFVCHPTFLVLNARHAAG
jgi:hypothetical protein